MATPLDDRDLAAEIALLGEVMAAVAAAAQELSDSEVDAVLGVRADAPSPKTSKPPQTPQSLQSPAAPPAAPAAPTASGVAAPHPHGKTPVAPQTAG